MTYIPHSCQVVFIHPMPVVRVCHSRSCLNHLPTQQTFRLLANHSLPVKPINHDRIASQLSLFRRTTSHHRRWIAIISTHHSYGCAHRTCLRHWSPLYQQSARISLALSLPILVFLHQPLIQALRLQTRKQTLQSTCRTFTPILSTQITTEMSPTPCLTCTGLTVLLSLILSATSERSHSFTIILPLMAQ